MNEDPMNEFLEGSEGDISSVREAADRGILNFLVQKLSETDLEDGEYYETFDKNPYLFSNTTNLSEPSSFESPVTLGQKFGKWKVKSVQYLTLDNKKPRYLLRCECGTVAMRSSELILSGKSASCGCE